MFFLFVNFTFFALQVANFAYNTVMTHEELKKEVLKKWGRLDLCAEEIGVSYSSLESVLNGRNPLTKSLKHHLQLALGLRKDTLIMFKVELPDEEVQSWVPGWDKLSEDERRAAVESIVREAALLGSKRGWEELSEPEREKLRALGREVAYWPNQTAVPVYRAPEDVKKPFA